MGVAVSPVIAAGADAEEADVCSAVARASGGLLFTLGAPGTVCLPDAVPLEPWQLVAAV